jgi:hypothetical protein
MADREISPPGRAAEVDIPAHAAAARKQGLRVRLEKQHVQDYGVWQKEMPQDIPTEYDGSPIDWFNNFGLKRAGSDAYEVTVPAYTIIVDKDPGGRHLISYDATRTPALALLATVEERGKLHATLDRGDPAVGWTS